MLHRAYSVITFSKAADEERRVITGVATTPTPDRVGDIIEPRGAKFKNPLTLLLYHDSKKPVGTVKFNKPTDDGITFEASFPKIDQPGPLRDRVEEAWGSVKSGLLRGVSIGFRALEDGIELLKETGGLRFTKIEVLELSLVAIPANSEARIETIKSFDAPHLAALGRSGVLPSGVTDTSASRRSKDASRMKTLTEVKTAIGTKKERLEELMNVSDPDDDQQTELAALPGEIKSLTAKAAQLQAIEDANLSLASEIRVPKSIQEGSQQRGGQQHQVTVNPNRPKEMGYIRAIICKFAGELMHRNPVDIAKARYPDDAQVIAHLKNAVAAGVTTDAGWAGNLVYADNLVSEFIEYLRPRTIIGQFGTGNIPSLRRVPFNSRGASQTAGGTGYWVGQGKLKPVTRLTTGTWSLPWSKAAALAVISQELVRFSSPSAESIVRDELTNAVREVLDRDFIDPDKAAVADVSPASITRGITPLTTTGTDAAAVRADVEQVLAALIAANIDPTNGVWIMPSTLALTLSLMRNPLGQKEFPDITMRGGMFEGFPVIASQYAVSGSPESNLLIFVNASDIFLADDGGFDVMVSREASIEMSDNPEGESGTVVSMFQSNQLAILAERYITWKRRRDASVQVLNNVAYASGSPA